MKRLKSSSRRTWFRYLVTSLAPLALWAVGCADETGGWDVDSPGLEPSDIWYPSSGASGVDCVKLTVKERRLNANGTTTDKSVSGVRVLASSTEYTHVGGAVYTNSQGVAGIEVRGGRSMQFAISNPAGYTVLNPIVDFTTGTPYLRLSNAGTDFVDCDFAGDVIITSCRNGIINKDGAWQEACDDGNNINDDGCTNKCSLPKCGDGIKQGSAPYLEACDDGNAVNGDGCDNNCTVSACGNGIQAGTEQCDDGNGVNGDGCDTNCKSTGCGNGIVTMGEQCDDGNTTNGDGCDSNCKPTGCGNGIATMGEQCDDGNTTNGDGCDNNCKNTACGNGVKTMGEGCDDGNTTSGDGCNAACLVEMSAACGINTDCVSGFCDPAGNICACDADTDCLMGQICKTMPNPNQCAAPLCGDGVLSLAEGCDDGNNTNGDGCNSTCRIELGFSCAGKGNAACGSGFCDATGNICACDDHADCPAGRVCNTTPNPNVCILAGCGNMVVEPTEQCDDGNMTNGDGCDNNCKFTGCGNGIPTNGEACDDGNATNGDGCDNNCTASACGNGIAAGTELCDDGNMVNGDGCDSNCKPTGCPNGIVTAGEQCDDGNTVNTDGCTNLCKLPFCGDGFVQAGEYCDDGDTNNLNACNNSCVAPGGTIASGAYSGPALGTDQGYAVAGAPNGAVFVGGVEAVSGQGVNAWLGKFSGTTGALSTAVSFNGAANGNDYVYGVATDASSNAITIGKEMTAANGYDIFIRKHNGTTLGQMWKVNHATAGDDIGFDIAVDKVSGNIAVVGVLSGAPQVMWIGLYNSSGTNLWMKTHTGTTNYAVGKMSVRIDTQSNVNASAYEVSLAGGADKLWNIQYTGGGGLVSAITFNATGYTANGIATDSNGDVLVTGFGPITTGSTQEVLWVQKYSALGATLWTQKIAGTTNSGNRGYDIAADSTRNVLVTGITQRTGEGVNVWSHKLSPNGGVLWSKEYNGAAFGNDYGMGIAANTATSALDNVLVTGYDAVTNEGSNVWVRFYGP